MHSKIPVYIINLIERPERKAAVLHEFINKDEFEVKLMSTQKHKIGAIGLWENIKNILSSMVRKEDDPVIICEDDHQFTKEYSKELLLSCIAEAEEKDADVLLGGIHGLSSAIPVSSRLFWAEVFTGTQFTVIFRKFFSKILNADFGPGDDADFKIGSLTDNKFFIHPFISVQKSFGYSDVTPRNNTEGRVEKLFKSIGEKAQILKKVKEYYNCPVFKEKNLTETRGVTIPAYIISLKQQINSSLSIVEEFQGRNEFDIKFVQACKPKRIAVDLWLSIRKVIKTAMKNEEDVIIICEENHQFTADYSKDFLIQNIIKAHKLSANYLIGGTSKFGMALPITNNLFWIDWCLFPLFIVIYKRFFQDILNEPFDEAVVPDLLLSEMTSNKMLLYPFISRQKDFSYSNVTSIDNAIEGLPTGLFNQSSRRLEVIRKVYFKYQEMAIKL